MQSSLARLCALGACVYLNAGCGGSSSNFYDPPTNGAVTPANTGTPSASAGAPSAAGGAPAASGGSASSNSSGGSASSNSSGGSASSNSSGGMPGSAGSVAAGGQPGSGPSNAPCSPATDVTNGESGVLGTTGPVCLRVTGAISGWGCSNFDGRTVKINGELLTCGQLPLPAEIDGDYYFDISAGQFEYASFFWF